MTEPTGRGLGRGAEVAALRGLVPVRSPRLYERVIDALSVFVAGTDLGPERRLPPERYLEQMLRVSRPVLREALRVLEMHGYVESRQGGGHYLVRSPLPNSRDLRRDTLTASKENLLSLWEARELIECRAAMLAATHATRGQIAAIRKPLALLAQLPPGDYRATDNSLQFHLAVARASGNPFYEKMIADLLAQFRAIGFKDLLSPEHWSQLQYDHKPILSAIELRNPKRAAAAMKRHFDSLRSALTAEVGHLKRECAASMNERPQSREYTNNRRRRPKAATSSVEL